MREGNPEGVCGQIVETGRDSISVKTGNGVLVLQEVQLEGKKRMDAGAFLRGFPLKAGTVLERS